MPLSKVDFNFSESVGEITYFAVFGMVSSKTPLVNILLLFFSFKFFPGMFIKNARRREPFKLFLSFNNTRLKFSSKIAL